MDVFKYCIIIPNTGERSPIRNQHFSRDLRNIQPYGIDGDNITYYPNVFALAVL